jgi:hypothetical protein
MSGLIQCPDCGKSVSNRAVSCPNCGCPVARTPAMPGPSAAMAPPTTPARKRRADISLLILGLVLLYPGWLMFSGAREQQDLNESLGSTSGGSTVMILLMGVVCVGVPLSFIVFGFVGRVPPLCKTCGREMRRRVWGGWRCVDCSAKR